jgi:hypothetical protein
MKKEKKLAGPVPLVDFTKPPYLILTPHLDGRGRDDGWWTKALLQRHEDHLKFIKWRLSADWGLFKIKEYLRSLEVKWAWMSQHPVLNKNLKKRQVIEEDAPVISDDDKDMAPKESNEPMVDPIEEVEDEPAPPPPAKKRAAPPQEVVASTPPRNEFDKIRVAISDLGGAIKDIKDRKFVGVRMHIKAVEQRVGLSNNPSSVMDRLAFIENALFNPETGVQQAVIRHEGVNKQVCVAIDLLRRSPVQNIQKPEKEEIKTKLT